MERFQHISPPFSAAPVNAAGVPLPWGQSDGCLGVYCNAVFPGFQKVGFCWTRHSLSTPGVGHRWRASRFLMARGCLPGLYVPFKTLPRRQAAGSARPDQSVRPSAASRRPLPHLPPGSSSAARAALWGPGPGGAAHAAATKLRVRGEPHEPFHKRRRETEIDRSFLLH